MIVVGGGRRGNAALRRKHLAQHLFGRGFAGAARHSNDARIRTRARRSAQSFQRRLCIISQKQRRIRPDIQREMAYQTRGGAFLDSRGGKHMAVALTFKRNEQVAGLNGPGVNRNARGGPIPFRCPTSGGSRFGSSPENWFAHAALSAANPPSACAALIASLRSENGGTSLPMI